MGNYLGPYSSYVLRLPAAAFSPKPSICHLALLQPHEDTGTVFYSSGGYICGYVGDDG